MTKEQIIQYHSDQAESLSKEKMGLYMKERMNSDDYADMENIERQIKFHCESVKLLKTLN